MHEKCCMNHLACILLLCSISSIFFFTSVNVIVHYAAVLPSTGIGSLSAREAEGRSNISAGEKVIPYKIFP